MEKNYIKFLINIAYHYSLHHVCHTFKESMLELQRKPKRIKQKFRSYGGKLVHIPIIKERVVIPNCYSRKKM